MSYKEYYYRQILKGCRELDSLTAVEVLPLRIFRANRKLLRRIFECIGLAATAVLDLPSHTDRFLNSQVQKMSLFHPRIISQQKMTARWVEMQAEWMCTEDLLLRLSREAGEENDKLRIVKQDRKRERDTTNDTLRVLITKSWFCLGGASLVTFGFLALLIFDWRMIISAGLMVVSALPFWRLTLFIFSFSSRTLERSDLDGTSEYDLLNTEISNLDAEIEDMDKALTTAQKWMARGYMFTALGFLVSVGLAVIFSLHITEDFIPLV